MGKALGYFRRALKQSDSALVRAVARERGFICESILILFTPSG